MACGSVASVKAPLYGLNGGKDSGPGTPRTGPREKVTSQAVPRETSAQDAVRFLQKEHEKILTGLHTQMRELQQRCDDLQFELHMRHITSSVEELLRKQIQEADVKLHEKSERIDFLERHVKQQESVHTEATESYKWKEVQLQQQLESANQKTGELKGELARLKSQVHDLRLYNSALRVGGTKSVSSRSSSRACLVSLSSERSPRIISQFSRRPSQESLDSLGPRSIGSDDGDYYMSYKGTRLGSSISVDKGTSRLGSAVPNSDIMSKRSRSFSAAGHLTFTTMEPLTQSVTLPPVTSAVSQSRPSSSVTLPPIQHTQMVTRPHVRKQLRLSSAPSADLSSSRSSSDFL